MARPKLAIGARVRTGRCTVVALAGSPEDPEFVDRRELSCWDSRVPDSQAPYHPGLELKGAEARRVVDRAVKAARRATRSALEAYVAELGSGRPRGLGLVVASLTDPGTIHQPHMRAHASEGRLFHEAMVEAAGVLGLPNTTWLEKALAPQAASVLGRRESQLRTAIALLGKEAGAPWRAQEKAACLAAWVVLAAG